MDLVLAKEAIIVGVLLLIIGLIIQFILKSTIYSFDEKKNKENYFMEVFLFVTGVVVHVLGEYIGVNDLYCKFGRACK
tara:strand:+ start:36 stop:269 length:234 start_codon:yes stop_codon:yes gene_type:complete